MHGYDTPQEIQEAGFQSDFDLCMTRAAELYDEIYQDFPGEAQYVVPFAYRTRWYMKMNLREAVHLCELRTMPQGHPDYRFIAQEMWRKSGKCIRLWRRLEDLSIGKTIVSAVCSRRCERNSRNLSYTRTIELGCK